MLSEITHQEVQLLVQVFLKIEALSVAFLDTVLFLGL